MGMPVLAEIRDPGEHEEAFDAVFAWLRAADETFSTYREASEVSRLARGELALEQATEDVRLVLARCDELREETRGYFDARFGGGLDPSGLVKGWSVDRAAALLDERGLANYALNAGGDIRVRGGALPEPAWRVGIQHPLLRDRVAAVLEVSDVAIATSAEYERGQHILDPHTGRPPGGVLSVTITGPDLATADAYATAAFAMGTAGPHWTARLPRGYEAMSILADERVLKTPGFPG